MAEQDFEASKASHGDEVFDVIFQMTCPYLRTAESTAPWLRKRALALAFPG